MPPCKVKIGLQGLLECACQSAYHTVRSLGRPQVKAIVESGQSCSPVQLATALHLRLACFDDPNLHGCLPFCIRLSAVWVDQRDKNSHPGSLKVSGLVVVQDRASCTIHLGVASSQLMTIDFVAIRPVQWTVSLTGPGCCCQCKS